MITPKLNYINQRCGEVTVAGLLYDNFPLKMITDGGRHYATKL